MTRRERGIFCHLWLVAAAALLSAAACGGSTSSNGTSKATPTSLAPSSSVAAPGTTPPPSGNLAASKAACALISASDAAAALGMAVGTGRPVPGVNLSNGAVGGSCEWSDSAGGTAVLVILKYPSATVASKIFNRSKGVTAISHPVRLPDLGRSAFADTDTYGGTRIAEGFVLDGDRELNVTLNEPPSSGTQFNVRAFVTLVQQAARAWR